MEQPKRISLDTSVSWIEGYDQLGDDWAADGLLENESFPLEEQTATFLPPPPSLIKISEMDGNGSDDDSAYYDHAADMIWEDHYPFCDNAHVTSLNQRAYYYHHINKVASIFPNQIWEERRRNFAFSIQRSKTTRTWIESSNIMKLCGQNTKEVIWNTLQSSALMEAVLTQQRDRIYKRKREE